MKSLVIALMAWASHFTGLPVPDQLPVVQHVSAKQLFHIAHPGAEYDPDSSVRYEGLYGNGFIYLKDDFDPSSIVAQSKLLHELVHHLQEFTDQRDACFGDKEKVAYGAQKKFLKVFGLDLHEDAGVGPLLYFAIISACETGHSGR